MVVEITDIEVFVRNTRTGKQGFRHHRGLGLRLLDVLHYPLGVPFSSAKGSAHDISRLVL